MSQISTLHPQSNSKIFNYSRDNLGEKAHFPVIFDIRQDKEQICLRDMTRSSIRDSGDHLELPTLLLWDEEGLQHFERITYHRDYYLTTDEIELLEKYSNEIAAKIAPNSILLELGSGYVYP
jgi:uncharacterized SAM-dependent methyltransferase